MCCVCMSVCRQTGFTLVARPPRRTALPGQTDSHELPFLPTGRRSNDEGTRTHYKERSGGADRRADAAEWAMHTEHKCWEPNNLLIELI